MTTLTKYRSMDESTTEDWRAVANSVSGDTAGMSDLILEMLKRLDGSSLVAPVTPYEHSLQTATRAFKDDADEEIIVCGLLHDIGDLMAPQNHAEFAASLVRPYVSDINHGVVLLHEIFQGYHYFDKVGIDRNLRERYRGHPSFQATAHFCEKWDQASFDQNYESMPLEAFEPMVRRIFARAPYSANRTDHVNYFGFRVNMTPGNATATNAA